MSDPQVSIRSAAKPRRRASRQDAVQRLYQELSQRRVAPGERLPSSRALGARWGISQATVHRALQRLARDGVLTCRPRSGWYLNALPAAAQRNAQLPRPRTLAGACMAVSFTGISSIQQVTGGERWTHRILAAFHQALAGEQVSLLLTHEPPDAFDADALLRQLDAVGDRLSGVLMFGPENVGALEAELDRRRMPWVTINRPHMRFLHNFVAADFVAAGRGIGVAFGALGYQRILMLGAQFEQFPSSREEFEGLCSGYVQATGRPIPSLHLEPCGRAGEEVGLEVTLGFLKRHPPPQAIFATGDYLAVGAIRACQQRGLRVPEDVAVVGASGLPVGQYVRPALTAFAQPMEQIGATAAQMLLHMARHGLQRVPGRLLPGDFLFRETLPADAALQERILAEIRTPE